MKKNEPISKLMTKDLITGNYSDTFSSIKKKMKDHHLHHIPIVDGGDLVGIVSRSDIANFSHSKAFGGNHPDFDESVDQTVTIKDIMTRDVTTLKSVDTVKHAVQVLNDNTFHSVPVVEGDSKKLVGIVTTTDVMSYLLSHY